MRSQKKFTDVIIKSSTGPVKNFSWLVGLVLGLAGMSTQLLVAWLATDDVLDANATREADENWTQVPWLVRGLSLGAASLILCASLCDIMGVALAADRVQKLATDRVASAAWGLKGSALAIALFGAVCVSIDYTQWSARVCILLCL